MLIHVAPQRFVDLRLIVADDASAYVFAGVFTVVAALIVVTVMLATSESKNDESS